MLTRSQALGRASRVLYRTAHVSPVVRTSALRTPPSLAGTVHRTVQWRSLSTTLPLRKEEPPIDDKKAELFQRNLFDDLTPEEIKQLLDSAKDADKTCEYDMLHTVHKNMLCKDMEKFRMNEQMIRRFWNDMTKEQRQEIMRLYLEGGGIASRRPRNLRELIQFGRDIYKTMNIRAEQQMRREQEELEKQMEEESKQSGREESGEKKDAEKKAEEAKAENTRGGGTGPGGPGGVKGRGGAKQGPGKPPGGGRDWKIDFFSSLIISAVVFALLRVGRDEESSREITWQEFRNSFLEKGLVEKLVVVNGSIVRVSLHPEATKQAYPDSPAGTGNFHYYFSVGSIDAFERRLEEAQREMGIPSSERIPVAYKDEISWAATLGSFAPTVLLIGALLFLTRRAGGGGGQSGIFGIGKSRAKLFNQETDIKTKFKDVAGCDEAKVEIMEFVSFLKQPEKFQRLGAKIPRGAILSGPPGTGKTLLAKATAGEAEVPFFSVSGSEFVEMFVGVGPSRVRDLFAKARKNAPCIIFIDEIDAIGKARAKSNFGGGNDERESTLNQILTEMDGFNTAEQVVVLAGTNRADVLDKALLRPGRFDRHITIDRPTMDGRKQIFQVHLKKIKTNEDMEHLSGRLSALTPGFAGADIANCVNEAALIAARGSEESVQMKHFEQAIERVIGGLEKKSLVLSPEEKRTVAYHEAGHAICGWYLKHADPLLKVSIIPRGQGALGYAQYLPNGEQYLMSVNQLMDRMAMTLGGRVSEELHFETVTSGASDDFNKVTRLATAMVTKWGMSKEVGYIHYEDADEKLQKPFSEETGKKIDAEVRRIVDEAYAMCKKLLTEKKKEVGIVAEELLSKEVLSRDDMIRLLGKRPFGDNKEFEKYFGQGHTEAPPPFPQERDHPDVQAHDDIPPQGPPAP